MRGQDALSFDADPFETAFGKLAGPLHLPSLTKAERDDAIGQLRGWVGQLVQRFSLEARVIPPCWEEHNGMIEALLALRDHERACYADSAAPTAAVDWLRALQEVTHFLTELNANTQCTMHEHRESRQRVTLRAKAPARTA